MDKKTRFVIILDVLVGLLVLIAVPISGWMFRFLPDCPWVALGWQCPSCGGTRCVRYLFSGRMAEAFAVNPFLFVLIWYLIAALLLMNVGVLLKWKWAEKCARAMTDWRMVIAVAVLFVIFGIVRNI